MMAPILIAECCQNHKGDKEILKRMIHSAAENGADYVKIQAIRSRELTHREKFDQGETNQNGAIITINRPYYPELERLQKLDLDLDTEKWFVDECLRAGVAPMTTIFTRSAVEELNDFGYEAIKIASYDCASYPLLKDIKKIWGRVFVSTGATHDQEIVKASEILQDVDLTFLHCVTIYPTPLDKQHLKRLNFLRRFTSKVGFSDHSKVPENGLQASKIALALGADCVERHFTVLGHQETKDGPVSITPPMLNELSDFSQLSRYERMEIVKKEIPDWETALGLPSRELSTTELLNRDYYRGRFASKVEGKDIFNWE